MKDVQATSLPPCDLCRSPGCGVYNTPTRRDDERTGGRWANMCGPCFNKHGLDTSITERRVLMEKVPGEVKAIANHWAGVDAGITKETEGVWRFVGPEDGFVYLVFSPGTDVAVRDNDGTPIEEGTCFPTQWVVQCTNDAPDAWWTIEVDGTYVPYNRPLTKIWELPVEEVWP